MDAVPHGDLGLWEDAQVETLRPLAEFLNAEGAIAGIQLSHAGRKASERRPWHGETPVDDEDVAERGEEPWTAIAPSPLPYTDGWPTPKEMTEDDIARVLQSFADAARRALAADFRVIEVYGAHGFLIHQFLSPISNHRVDAWGDSLENRARFAVEVAKSIRREWPENLPLLFRLSASDWLDGGLEMEDTVDIAKRLKDVGVDMIDCSTGGIGGKERPRRMKIEHGFQLPFAERIRAGADIPTMGVGFLWDAQTCEDIVATGQADMIAVAREVLDDPHWPHRAAQALGAAPTFEDWPIESGWWLSKRHRLVEKLGLRATPEN